MLQTQFNLFIELSVLEDDRCQAVLVQFLQTNNQSERSRISIIFHNGDKMPSQKFYAKLSDLGCRVFSVNIVNSKYGVTALPIGLENRHHRRNGKLRPYLKYSSRRTITNDCDLRSRLLLATFSVGTNPTERGHLRELCAKYGVEFFEPHLRAKHYRSLVKRSMFVLSPPGNGLDCHRTWEALYLGSVPVVRREMLDASFIDSLPIYVLDDWEEVFEKSNSELLNIFFDLQGRSHELLYMDHWTNVITSRVDRG